MSDPGRRALFHATGPRAAELEELQFTLGEGPARTVQVEQPGAGGRSGRARLAGVVARVHARGRGGGGAAVFAFPLVQGAIRVGVLGLYRATPGSLSPGALADVLVCADIALLLLLNSRAGLDGNGDGLAEDGWFDDHARVYQATGMLSAQRGVGLEAALALLRAYAFSHDLTLDEVAAAVVARRLRLDSEGTGFR